MPEDARTNNETFGLRRPERHDYTPLPFPLPSVDIRTLEAAGFVRGGSTVYGGAVASNGSAGAFFPSGWTASRSEAGIYVITHDLGHQNYAVSVTLDDGSVGFITVAYANDTFTVRTSNTTPTLADRAFHFIVAL